MSESVDTDLGLALRQAIAASGLTRAQVSKRAGIGYAAIHGFVGGTRDLTLDSASKVVAALGLRVELNPARHKRK